MASQPPPNPNVNTFNNSYWSSTTPLTQAEADLLYLQYPISQNVSETFRATAIFNQGLNLNNSNITNGNAITATTFNGALNGNASTATNISLGTAGDLLYQSASNTTAKLPIGTNTYVLTSNGSAPTWTAPFVPTTPTLSNVLVAGNSAGSNNINMNSQDITNGGQVTATTFNGALNGNASSATSATTASNIAGGVNGDLLYQNNTSSTTKLPIGTINQVLASNGSAPVWVSSSTVAPNLSAVLTAGNSAGSSSINMNNNAISAVSTLAVNSTSTFGNTVSINIAAAGTAKTGLGVVDTTLSNNILLVPSNTSGYLSPFANPGSSAIVSLNGTIGNQPLEIYPWSNTTCGLRLTGSSALLGAGGTASFQPTSSISFAGTSATMTGDLNMNTGNITNATSITATTFNGTATTATNANNLLTTNTNTETMYLLGSNNSATNTGSIYKTTGSGGLGLYYIPSSGTLWTSNFSLYQYGNTLNTSNIGINAGVLEIYNNGNPTPTITRFINNNSTSTPRTVLELNGNAGTSTFDGNALTATTATKVALTTDNTSGTYLIPFAKALSTSEALYVDNATGPLTYNPNNSTLTATTFNGSANLVNVSATIPAGVYNIPVCSGTGASQQLRSDLILQYDTTVSPPNITANLNGQANSALTATTATKVSLTNDNTSGTYVIPFAKSTSSSETLYVDNATGPLTYNPNSSTLTATTFSGTATKVATTSDNTSGTYFIPFTKTATSSETLYVDNSSGPLTYNPNSATLSTTTFQGALNGTATNALQATNQANGVAIPAMYFFYAHITGGGSSESGTFTFTALPDTNYAVFSSIYYGYTGSSGTYNATNSSSAINTMIINSITTSSFSWVFTRSSGDNLAVYAVFQLIRSPSLDYPKVYS
jgi:hypothetical protein